MKLKFTKMQGLGNDFVVVDAIRQAVRLSTEQCRHLGDRRFGIGCDQILLAEPATRPGPDYRYRIFNADGGEVEQCGNGVRCLGRFLVDKGFAAKENLTVETLAGDIRIRLLADGQVAVDMGQPVLTPTLIPFRAEGRATEYSLDVHGETVTIAAVSMGNPHAVVRVDSVGDAPVARLGAAIESHPRFPRRVNVGFMEIVSPEQIRLRVFERGVGETLACGTGACAAVVAGRLAGHLADRVCVDLPGGRLEINWQGEGHSVWMIGPATTVFEGEIEV